MLLGRCFKEEGFFFIYLNNLRCCFSWGADCNFVNCSGIVVCANFTASITESFCTFVRFRSDV